MTLPPTNCPNCNSIQLFAVHERVREDLRTETYIRCRLCRHEVVLAILSPEQLQSRSRFRRRRNALARKRKQ